MKAGPLTSIALALGLSVGANIVNVLQRIDLTEQRRALQTICATLPRQVMMDCETLERPARP